MRTKTPLIAKHLKALQSAGISKYLEMHNMTAKQKDLWNTTPLSARIHLRDPEGQFIYTPYGSKY